MIATLFGIGCTILSLWVRPFPSVFSDSYWSFQVHLHSLVWVRVRICDPTTQLHSRAEPKDPICSPYLSLLRFRLVSALLPDLSPLYCTSPYFTFFTSVHLLISHLSPVPPIFPSVCLCYLDFLRTLMFHPYLLCSTRVVFKISCIPYPQNLHCYFLLPSAYPCLICPSRSISKSPGPCVSVRPSESGMDSDRLAFFDLRSSFAFHSGSTCDCMIVNSYQPDAFLTPRSSIPGNVRIPSESECNSSYEKGGLYSQIIRPAANNKLFFAGEATSFCHGYMDLLLALWAWF